MKYISKAKWSKQYHKLSTTGSNWDVSMLNEDPAPTAQKSPRSFSAMNRTHPGRKSVWPPMFLQKGTMEFLILDGTFRCNGKLLKTGDYMRVTGGEKMRWTSSGGEMFLSLNGVLLWEDSRLTVN